MSFIAGGIMQKPFLEAGEVDLRVSYPIWPGWTSLNGGFNRRDGYYGCFIGFIRQERADFQTRQERIARRRGQRLGRAQPQANPPGLTLAHDGRQYEVRARARRSQRVQTLIFYILQPLRALWPWRETAFLCSVGRWARKQ